MFTPRWKKEAKLLYKGSKKFLHYKRDLLAPEKIEAIEAARADLLEAMKANDKEANAKAERAVTKACEQSLPSYRRQNAIEENIEVFFVAIVVALGIRAYFLQPFRIPTGSMQPTLNGLTGELVQKADFPAAPVRWVQRVLRGRGYVYEELDRDRTFISPDLGKSIVQVTRFNFFTRTHLRFTDGTLSIGAPMNVVLQEFGLAPKLQLGMGGKINNLTLKKGTVVASGYVDSGDLVLVDKVSYNFRKPKRGEVWVFDTRGIEGIHKRSGPQGAGSHYIKRLAGVPGDTIQIQPPLLLVNGEPAREKKLDQVMNSKGPFQGEPGYSLAQRERVPRPLAIPDNSTVVKLKDEAPPGYREYFSLGDNTDNSLDSRYWGPVREFNVVGPALFSLWPITTGHWGFIK
ncbi:MAG: signal peptidase I [Akkermansiaceae bacterium]|nr:signal peptidase I [Akkermansiaceae bacterium]NNM29814.1 signal peptidase I [Akkermansiaceae bacterium]